MNAIEWVLNKSLFGQRTEEGGCCRCVNTEVDAKKRPRHRHTIYGCMCYLGKTREPKSQNAAVLINKSNIAVGDDT